MNKIDRALEIAVIDWLQWAEHPDGSDKPDMAQLALTMLGMRKKYCEKLEKRVKDLETELIVWKSGALHLVEKQTL